MVVVKKDANLQTTKQHPDTAYLYSVTVTNKSRATGTCHHAPILTWHTGRVGLDIPERSTSATRASSLRAAAGPIRCLRVDGRLGVVCARGQGRLRVRGAPIGRCFTVLELRQVQVPSTGTVLYWSYAKCGLCSGRGDDPEQGGGRRWRHVTPPACAVPRAPRPTCLNLCDVGDRGFSLVRNPYSTRNTHITHTQHSSLNSTTNQPTRRS